MTPKRLTLVVVDQTSLSDLPIGDGPWKWITPQDEGAASDLTPDEVAMIDVRNRPDGLEFVTQVLVEGEQRRTVVLIDDATRLLKRANERDWEVELVLGYATPLAPA